MSRRLDKITDEAALWFVRAQNPEFSNEDRKELASWLAASAEHVQEYLALTSVVAGVAGSVEEADVDELIELAQKETPGAEVIAFSGLEEQSAPVESGSAGPGGKRMSRWAVAAIVLVAVMIWYQQLEPSVAHYETGIGEQTMFLLDDGSVVSLNAQSTLQVLFDDDSRDVRLVSGEALFDVEKDANRPFRVSTESAIAEAFGTQFNVRYRGSDTTVTVVEGLVDVQSPSTGASAPSGTIIGVGQQARVNTGEIAVIETDVQEATSWRERRLVFDARPLSDVVYEFNLFNDQQILIADPGIAGRAISGSFEADDRESFALFLSEVGIADFAQHSDGSIELRDIVETGNN